MRCWRFSVFIHSVFMHSNMLRAGCLRAAGAHPVRAPRCLPRPEPPGSAHGRSSPTCIYSAGGKSRGADGRTGGLRSAHVPAVSPAQAVAPGPLLTTGKMLPRAARRRFSSRGGQQKKFFFFSCGSCGEARSGRYAAPGETPLRGCAACAARGSGEPRRCGAGCGGPGLRSAFSPQPPGNGHCSAPAQQKTRPCSSRKE